MIVLAATTFLMGLIQGKEYGELIQPFDAPVTLTWVSYAIVLFGILGHPDTGQQIKSESDKLESKKKLQALIAYLHGRGKSIRTSR